jgi:hypothetical protein
MQTVPGSPGRSLREHAVLLERDGVIPTDTKAITSILELGIEITGMPVAILARITDTRWLALAVRDTIDLGIRSGLVMDPVVTLCKEVCRTGEPVFFHHASRDPRFSSHPLPATYGIESYLAVPVVLPGGKYFGNLCFVGTQPAPPVTALTMSRVQLLADLAARQLSEEETSTHALAQERDEHAADRRMLEAERAASRRLEHVLAVVGHDLRNPLASIVGGAQALGQQVGPGIAAAIVDRIHRSAERMVTLVDDLLDVERARLCGEIGVRLREVADIAPLLRHVIEEISLVHVDRTIDLRLEGLRAAPCRCDPARIGQHDRLHHRGFQPWRADIGSPPQRDVRAFPATRRPHSAARPGARAVHREEDRRSPRRRRAHRLGGRHDLRPGFHPVLPGCIGKDRLGSLMHLPPRASTRSCRGSE